MTNLENGSHCNKVFSKDNGHEQEEHHFSNYNNNIKAIFSLLKSFVLQFSCRHFIKKNKNYTLMQRDFRGLYHIISIILGEIFTPTSIIIS